MKTIILHAGILLMALAFANNVCAVGQGGGSGDGAQSQTADQAGAVLQTQNQAANQGEINQIQTQTSAQTNTQTQQNAQAQGGAVQQGGVETQTQQQSQTVNQGAASQMQIKNNQQTQTGAGTGTQTQPQQQDREQIQQKLQDGSNEGQQTQTQDRFQSQEHKTSQTQEGGGFKNAEQRRSQVANAVQQMLQVADREGGIGQQVKIIAQVQTQNQEKIETSLQAIQSRSDFAKFFIGPNYGEVNNAQKLLQQNREQIVQLNQIKAGLANEGDQQILASQIQILEQANLQIENSLNESQKGFSLLGWVFKMFTK